MGVIALIPNDYVRDPEDAPEQVNCFAKEHGVSFPYVVPPEAHRPQNQLDPSWARNLAVA